MPSVSKEELDKEHMLVLYAVNKAPDGIPTKTHYQKIIYLVLKALKNDPKVAGYRPHRFGPYSARAECWRDELIDAEYLIKNSVDRVRINPIVKNDVDRITFKDVLTMIKINEIVEFICSLSYDELLLFIYADDVQKGEGMSENSDEKDRIFRSREDLAIRMTRSGKVSVARGAELADQDVMTFREKIGGKI